MEAYYFTFQSMTRAQEAAALLRRYGLKTQLLRTPKAISGTGCGYALQLSPHDAYDGIFLLRNESVYPGKVYLLDQYNNGREVIL